jgi:hypothetical protein
MLLFLFYSICLYHLHLHVLYFFLHVICSIHKFLCNLPFCNLRIFCISLWWWWSNRNVIETDKYNNGSWYEPNSSCSTSKNFDRHDFTEMSASIKTCSIQTTSWKARVVSMSTKLLLLFLYLKNFIDDF